MRRGFAYSKPSDFEPTVRFPTSSGYMGAVPPPVHLTIPNAAAIVTDTMTKDLERKKEEQYDALMSNGGKSTTGKPEPRKKKIYDDEYLEKDSDDELEYQPVPGSPGANAASADDGINDEEDPLDAFMAGVDKQAKQDKAESERKDKERCLKVEKGVDLEDDETKGLGRADIDDEDMQESYFKFMEEHKTSTLEDEIYEYDEDGNIIWTWKKVIDPLQSIDHSAIEYAPFNKNFYHEHEQIKSMTTIKVFELRNSLNLKVAGFNPPKPVTAFAHFGFDEALMNAIRKSEYEHPTPIQSQSIPAALSGRDVLGIAKTGSGKTVAYLWPAIIHIMDQPDLKEGDGPIALVIVPTRELALQVYQEAKRYCKVYNISVVCAYGGGNKWEQQNALTEGAELVIATPGRIIDLVKINATNFTRVTFLVFDEADRMFDMGFEAQVQSISDHIRPDRQCLMFSATFKSKVEKLAREALTDPVRIVQGEVGEANSDIIQTIEVLENTDGKWQWLLNHLVKFSSMGKVLIFVTKKINAEDVANRLRAKDFKPILLHGDMLQAERNEKLQAFRKDANILVATDVAARGLDILEIKTVINFDLARDIDTHVHRIGRTGRAGQKGWAYTLVQESDKEMAGHLVRNLESVNQVVPESLLQLAMKSAWFRNSRERGASRPQQRLGLGYKPKTKGPRTDTATASITRALNFEEGQKKVKSVLDMAKATDGSTNRLQAMKAAFKSSFSSTFRPSTSDEWAASRAPATDPTPEWKRKLEEAAEAVNRQVAASINSSFVTHEGSCKKNTNTSDGPTFGNKKRSRWH
ncbi:DEAD/DEAH box helicase family protein [Acanthocheilonema viteae]|uniref:RNA helicase n=1 Tax=Acanthocheilonema viteae TaxID=6277 RepID=A0A498SBA2_ACAVI|nr:unnamed protein product [Acanthocheilonema viteae]